MKNDEVIILCGRRTEEEIERAVAFLVSDFPMAKNSGLTYRAVREDDPSYLRSAGFLGIIPEGADYWGKFTTTIERMQTAVQDFEKGWKAAMDSIKTKGKS